ncbi:MAG: ComF family protein [Burkholderiaceae bacterium]|nr:ComF family protein [Burkholderiaceae bacterium]
MSIGHCAGTRGAARGGVVRRLSARLRVVSAQLLDACLPACCIVCGSPHPGGLCADCETALPGGAIARCARCGLGLGLALGLESGRPDQRGHCSGCAVDPPPFERTLVLADYAPPLDRIVQALKYGREAALARPLGRALARRFAAAGETAQVVTAVPLSASRLAARGFNQSLEIARAMAGEARLPLEHRLLQRTRGGAPAATLHARERRLALAGAFAAPWPLDGRHVILVDDVMTTGATLRAAAAALRQAGAVRVVNCVVARTPPAEARPHAQCRPGAS